MCIRDRAYAHHKDDLIETLLLTMIYEGRFYSLSTANYMDRTGLTVIRPMIYAVSYTNLNWNI